MRASVLVLSSGSALLLTSGCAFDTRPIVSVVTEIAVPRESTSSPFVPRSEPEGPSVPVADPPSNNTNSTSLRSATPPTAADAQVAHAAPSDDDAGMPVSTPPVTNAPAPMTGASTPDAGSGGESPAVEPARDGACHGVKVSGLCWYLSTAGEGCIDTCDARGGFEPKMSEFVGNAAQGGSLNKCASIMNALGYPGPLYPSERPDDLGFGCHIWEDGMTYWLDDEGAPFDPRIRPEPWLVRLACACRH